MIHRDAIQFLEEHQPMPDNPPGPLMEGFLATTRHFYDNPDPACIPLYLNALGEWDDYLSLYESIRTIILRFPKHVVLPHLKLGLEARNKPTRLWCADFACYLPDESMIPRLRRMLKEEDPAMRMVAAAALECIGTSAVCEVAEEALLGEDDPTVRAILNAIITGNSEDSYVW